MLVPGTMHTTFISIVVVGVNQKTLNRAHADVNIVYFYTEIVKAERLTSYHMFTPDPLLYNLPYNR